MIPRTDGDLPETLLISGDGLTELLTYCRPLVIHHNRDGDELVRWAVPSGLVDGLEATTCECCGCTPLILQDGGVALDILMQDIPLDTRLLL